MTPVNYNNYRNYNNDTWLPNLFNDFFGGADWDWLTKSSKAAPAINILEDSKTYMLEMAVPGIAKEDCNIRLNHDTLTIACDKKAEAKGNDEAKTIKFLRREFSSSHFEQNFELPDNVDKKGIRAEVKDGVLTVTLPKKGYKAEDEGWREVSIK